MDSLSAYRLMSGSRQTGKTPRYGMSLRERSAPYRHLLFAASPVLQLHSYRAATKAQRAAESQQQDFLVVIPPQQNPHPPLFHLQEDVFRLPAPVLELIGNLKPGQPLFVRGRFGFGKTRVAAQAGSVKAKQLARRTKEKAVLVFYPFKQKTPTDPVELIGSFAQAISHSVGGDETPSVLKELQDLLPGRTAQENKKDLFRQWLLALDRWLGEKRLFLVLVTSELGGMMGEASRFQLMKEFSYGLERAERMYYFSDWNYNEHFPRHIFRRSRSIWVQPWSLDEVRECVSKNYKGKTPLSPEDCFLIWQDTGGCPREVTAYIWNLNRRIEELEHKSGSKPTVRRDIFYCCYFNVVKDHDLGELGVKARQLLFSIARAGQSPVQSQNPKVYAPLVRVGYLMERDGFLMIRGKGLENSIKKKSEEE